MHAKAILFLAILLLTITVCVAQDDPPPAESPAVSSYQYQVESNSERDFTGEFKGEGGAPQREKFTLDNTYYSPNLGAHFLAQWMYINQGGRQYNFWGARIIRLDRDSPLHELRLRSGDVVTRLDGVQIWRNMFRESRGPWQLVQMEEHYGLTEVRYIVRGTQLVRVGSINLDTRLDDPRPIPP